MDIGERQNTPRSLLMAIPVPSFSFCASSLSPTSIGRNKESQVTTVYVVGYVTEGNPEVKEPNSGHKTCLAFAQEGNVIVAIQD